jgi:methionyl-tRNA synthetase
VPLLTPFLPESAEKLASMLNFQPGDWQSAARAEQLPAGHQLREPALLFAKIDDAVVHAQVQKLLDTKQANALANRLVTAAKENVSFEEFGKMDLRVGTIVAAEKVAKTKKLLKLSRRWYC